MGVKAAEQLNGARSKQRAGDLNDEFLRSLPKILQQRERQGVLREATEMLNRSLRPESISIIETGPSGQAPKVLSSVGSHDVIRKLMATAQFGLAMRTTFRRGQPMMLRDLLVDGLRGQPRSAGRPLPPAVLLTPIKGLRGPFGVFALLARRQSSFGGTEARLVATVADVVSFMLREFDKQRAQGEIIGRYRRLVSGRDVVYMATVVPAFRLTFLSPAIREMTGYTPAEFYRDPDLIFRILHPDDLPAVRSDLERPERLVGRTWLRLISKDGERVWVSVSRSPVHDRHGKVVGLLGSFGRITSQVIERALLSARAETRELIVHGRRFEHALSVTARQLRYVLDASEVLVVMDTPRNAALRVVCREGLNGKTAGNGAGIRRDPVVRKALNAGGPVTSGADLATVIPWASERIGLLIVRGVAGHELHVATATEWLVRFGQEIAAALESMRTNARRLQQAIDQDRSRIAQELHDGVVQTLFAVALQLQLQLAAAPEPLRSSVKQATAGIREAIQDMQQYVYDLDPSLLMLGGLEGSLRQLALEFEATTGVTLTLETDPEAIASLEPAATHILQIVREALSNVRRHAQARNVSLTLRRTPRASLLEVRDDGKGFAPEAAQGLGLRNLRARARQLGGKLELHSELGKGSTLRLTVPLPLRQPEPAVEPLPV